MPRAGECRRQNKQQHPVMHFHDALRGDIEADTALASERPVSTAATDCLLIIWPVVDDHFRGDGDRPRRRFNQRTSDNFLCKQFGWRAPGACAPSLALNRQGAKLSKQIMPALATNRASTGRALRRTGQRDVVAWREISVEGCCALR